MLVEASLKTQLLNMNLLVLADPKKAKLSIIAFQDVDSLALADKQSLLSLIRKTINTLVSKSIPINLILDNKDEMIYLKSGKLDRNHYFKKHIQAHDH